MFTELDLDPDALDHARGLGILVQRGDRIDFTHPLVAASAYHLMPEDLRIAAHRVLALTMSAHGNIERGAYHAGSVESARPRGRGAPPTGRGAALARPRFAA